MSLRLHPVLRFLAAVAVVMSGAIAIASVSRPHRALATANLTYSNCSTAEQSAVATAFVDAASYSSTAVSYFSNNRSGARFTKWFGAYSATRWSHVRDVYAALVTAFTTASLTAVCNDVTCGVGGAFAYVYPSDLTRTIYLCQVFLDVATPSTGTDSRAGTLIHEFTHFIALAPPGTQDHAYGQTAAMNLATTDPTSAIDNADNYEYFAENNLPTTDNAPAFTQSTSSLTLPNTQIGNTQASPLVTITNTGDASLVISSITASAEFTISGGTCLSTASVAPSGTCTFGVVFAPSTSGSKSGSVSIATNSVVTPTAITLSGLATSPPPPTTVPPTTTSTTVAPVVSVATAPTSTLPTLTVTRVKVKAVKSVGAIRVAVNDGQATTRRTFRVQRQSGSKWVTLTKQYRTAAKNGSIDIDVPKGAYRIIVEATSTLSSATSSAIKIVR